MYDVTGDEDTLITNFTMDNATISEYQGVQMPPYSIENLEEQRMCYMVKIEYGIVGQPASEVSQSTDKTCWNPTCNLTNPTIVNTTHDVSDDGKSIEWGFDTSVTPNKWCEYVNQVVCVKDEVSGAKWCNQPDESTASASIVVKQ